MNTEVYKDQALQIVGGEGRCPQELCSNCVIKKIRGNVTGCNPSIANELALLVLSSRFDFLGFFNSLEG
jgi:hypothetical protein